MERGGRNSVVVRVVRRCQKSLNSDTITSPDIRGGILYAKELKTLDRSSRREKGEGRGRKIWGGGGCGGCSRRHVLIMPFPPPTNNEEEV